MRTQLSNATTVRDLIWRPSMYDDRGTCDVAVRCEAISNMLHMTFNDNGVWHDSASGRTAFEAGI